MSPDSLTPSLSASRSLTSFIQELDTYDPADYLVEGEEETRGFVTENLLKYLRCVRGFLTSARSRIIEAQLARVKEQLAVLSGSIQELSDQIFLLERAGKRTPEELQSSLAELIGNLLKNRERIVGLASELKAVGSSS